MGVKIYSRNERKIKFKLMSNSVLSQKAFIRDSSWTRFYVATFRIYDAIL